MATATPARIRRCNRDASFAIRQDPPLLSVRPDAKPAGSDDYTTDSFWDSLSHAQAMVNERFSILSSNRRHEAAESSSPLRIGTQVPIAPQLPKVQMIDPEANLDQAMTVIGIAVDLETDRNAIEAVG